MRLVRNLSMVLLLVTWAVVPAKGTTCRSCTEDVEGTSHVEQHAIENCLLDVDPGETHWGSCHDVCSNSGQCIDNYNGLYNGCDSAVFDDPVYVSTGECYCQEGPR
jgi:hypothetical protein